MNWAYCAQQIQSNVFFHSVCKTENATSFWFTAGLRLPRETSLWSGCCTSAGTSCIRLRLQTQPCLQNSRLFHQLLCQINSVLCTSYNHIATQHVTMYLHLTCILHSSFTEFVWGLVHLIQNTWFNRRFSVTLEFCVILAKQDLKSMESRHKTESTFKTHSEQFKHGHNVTKQSYPGGIRTVITSNPFNTAPGTWSRLLSLNPD